MDIHYKPESGRLWDHWIYQDPRSKMYHLYYLFIPSGGKDGAWTVAHATSKDLKEFKEEGIVLEAGKKPGHWIDKHLATGSVIEYKDRYAMVLTGHSSRYGEAPCLAWSDDLYNWELDDCGPLVLPETANGELEGSDDWGKPDPDCCGFCDPYLFKLDNDENFYFILNARIKSGEKQGRGRAALFSSLDMYNWKFERILESPHCFKRMETQQLICRNDRWYLIFSSWAHLVSDDCKQDYLGQDKAAAFVFTSSGLEGPYQRIGSFRIFPDESAYICKIITAPDGKDVVFTIAMNNGETGISKAIPVSYPLEGGISACV